MNTRLLYHWLLGLSAASIVALGLLLVRSEQRGSMLRTALHAEQVERQRLQSHTVEYVVQKAKKVIAPNDNRLNLPDVKYNAWFDFDGQWRVGFYVWPEGTPLPSSHLLGEAAFDRNGNVIEHSRFYSRPQQTASK